MLRFNSIRHVGVSNSSRHFCAVAASSSSRMLFGRSMTTNTSSMFTCATFAHSLQARRFCSSNSSGAAGNKSSVDGTMRLDISDADLAAANTMPPLLQYNEALVSASLALVEFANGEQSSAVMTPELEAKIGAVMSMIFDESYVPLADQIAVVRDLLAVPAVRETEPVRDAAHAILAALVPDAVMGLLVSVDRDVENFDAEAVEEVSRFVSLVVQGSDSEDEFVAALQSLQARVPQIDQNTHFIVLLQNINHVLLQARMAALLTEACLSFDPSKSGRIKVAELQESLRRIMPSEAADKIMAGVEADDDGTVSYSQMCRILLRGDDIKFAGAVQAEGKK